jgi:hypothetical protein
MIDDSIWRVDQQVRLIVHVDYVRTYVYVVLHRRSTDCREYDIRTTKCIEMRTCRSWHTYACTT